MAPRSRKRRGGDGPPPAGNHRGAHDGVNGEDRTTRDGATRGDRTTRGDRMGRGYDRGRARDDAARAALEPLAPGERPRAVTVAAILAALLGAANLVLLAAGWEIEGGDQSVAGVLIFAALMGAAAIGMWRCRYWAVLGFEALLGIAIVYAALALLVASNLAAVVRCLAIIAVAAPLFWFLIRAMARIQLPSRQPHEPVG